jgi:hypothetical protein
MERGFKAGPVFGLIGRQAKIGLEICEARICVVDALTGRKRRPFGALVSVASGLSRMDRRKDDEGRHSHNGQAGCGMLLHVIISC